MIELQEPDRQPSDSPEKKPHRDGDREERGFTTMPPPPPPPEPEESPEQDGDGSGEE